MSFLQPFQRPQSSPALLLVRPKRHQFETFGVFVHVFRGPLHLVAVFRVAVQLLLQAPVGPQVPVEGPRQALHEPPGALGAPAPGVLHPGAVAAVTSCRREKI